MPGQGLHIISTFKNLHVTSNSTLGVYSLLLRNNDKNLSKGSEGCETNVNITFQRGKMGSKTI